MKNPWKKLSTKTIYDNPWIKVEEDTVINPSGRLGIYGKVFFKNTAVGIIALDNKNNTWLVNQYRYTLKGPSWEVPMGGAKPGENLLDAAKRELKEETGLIANSWHHVMEIHTSDSVTDKTGHLFIAKDLKNGDPDFDDTEVIVIKKMPFKQAFDMALSGDIFDSMSVAGIFKVAHLFPELR